MFLSSYFHYFTTGLLNAAVKMLIKFHMDTHFRIVVFRRNSSHRALPHKSTIMPACGAYGQVLLLTDETLQEIWEGGGARMSQWVLAEVYYPVEASGANWRQVVHTELLYADFVLFDWSFEITENMSWEFKSAISLIPSSRMMIVCNLSNKQIIVELVNRIRSGLGTDIDIIAGPDPDEPISTPIFRSRFQKKMESLRDLQASLGAA